MVHCPTIMQMVGPLVNMWTMRFEAEHRISKLAANVVSSHVNITKTLAIKHQLKLCQRFVKEKGFSEELEMTTTSETFSYTGRRGIGMYI